MSAITEGHLLNKRVRYAQPAVGFRSGIEPVLLAAAIAARPNQRVLEGGTGAGAALLCLGVRVPGVRGCGIECDSDQAALARTNLAANGLDGFTVITGDLTDTPLESGFDHAFANPPYHAESGSVSPDARRVLAKRGNPALLGVWAAALGRTLRPRGTLTFILPAEHLAACLDAMAAAGCPVDAILPLWPRVGAAAKLLIARGIKGGRGGSRLLPGLALHEMGNSFTPAARAILRDGGPLRLE